MMEQFFFSTSDCLKLFHHIGHYYSGSSEQARHSLEEGYSTEGTISSLGLNIANVL